MTQDTEDVAALLVERVARAICLAGWDREDPDELICKVPPEEDAFEAEIPEGYRENDEWWQFKDGDYIAYFRRWRYYAPQARSAIKAIDDARAALHQEGIAT